MAKEIPAFFHQMKSLVEDAHTRAKVEGKNFFIQSFNRQGFLDESLKAWDKRQFNDNGGAVLIQSGALKRGIYSRSQGIERVVFGVDANIPYAKIHNEGGDIVVTAKMKRYFWYLYLQITGAKKGRKDGSQLKEQYQYKKDGNKRDNQRNRKLSSLAEFYKAMACKKVGSVIHIPKRQFLGESATLLREFDHWVITEIERRFTEL